MRPQYSVCSPRVFPRPSPANKHLKMSDLGWPKSRFRFGVPCNWSVAVGTWWRIEWLGLCSYTVWLCFMVLWYVFFCCWVLLGNLKYPEEESDEKNVSNVNLHRCKLILSVVLCISLVNSVIFLRLVVLTTAGTLRNISFTSINEKAGKIASPSRAYYF